MSPLLIISPLCISTHEFKLHDHPNPTPHNSKHISFHQIKVEVHDRDKLSIEYSRNCRFGEKKLESLSESRKKQETYIVSFEPRRGKTEDRYKVCSILVGGRHWILRAVFDGHGGDKMSKWTSKKLEKIVQEKLECNLQQENTIPELLEASIRELDDRLTRPLKELFPEGQLTRISKDTSPASKKGKEAHRATKMYSCGSTVLVALTDPEQRNLWVASLGDCQAMLGYKVSGEWAVRTLSGYHNTSNPDEESRIRMEHPNEPQCVADGRVLGRLLVTRAVGDLAFKLPAEYSQVLGSTKQEEVRDLIAWSRTPPYISNVAEVQHVSLESEFQRGCKMYLIMCSDGLVDLYERRGVERGEMGRVWIDILRKKIGSSFTKEEKNKALRLLKYGLGNDLAVIKDTIAKTERQDRTIQQSQ